jgi:hypothetical protein
MDKYSGRGYGKASLLKIVQDVYEEGYRKIEKSLLKFERIIIEANDSLNLLGLKKRTFVDRLK